MNNGPPDMVRAVQRVVHPPGWRGVPFALDFVILDREPDGAELLEVCRWARLQDLENPRVLSPQVLAWASIFQPNLFASLQRDLDPSLVRRLHFVSHRAAGQPRGMAEQSLFWLQSIVFLASVTLSAAIVQCRWSAGTIESKYDRLWQASVAAALPAAIDGDSVRRRVSALAAREDLAPIERFLEIRSMFFEIAEGLAQGIVADRVQMARVGVFDPERFGFVTTLAQTISGLQAIIVYGSSVSSAEFEDYDLVLVVHDAEAVLRSLESSSPTWAGKELNLGVYTPKELWFMQLLSGDNLADYGLCLYGEVELPQKATEALLARNLSFGVVRQRQQLGMVARAAMSEPADHDDRRNLYHYFVKIPSNVAKGTIAAAGARKTKEEVNRWLRDRTGFDTAKEQALALSGDPAGPLARAAVATGQVLDRLNDQLSIVEFSGGSEI